ncbi:MAG: hypothetical protein M3Q60_02350 [Actinomycetota bacterium]|nr:hypothetical protein [Actinomycetota bacterium]
MESPANPSGGGAYPDWTKSQLLLLFLWNKLQEAWGSGHSALQLIIYRGSGRTGLQVGYPKTDVSDELPELSRGGEAVAVFDRLWREDYIHVDFGGYSPTSAFTPVLLNLSSKGMTDIGKFPDPDAKFAAALAAAYRAIEHEPSIPETQKRDALDTLEKTASLATNVGGIARAFFDGLAQGG